MNITYVAKNRGIAVALALFTGGLGIHRFYVGRIGTGFAYALFFWTFIPAILGVVQALQWAFMSEASFQERYTTKA